MPNLKTIPTSPMAERCRQDMVGAMRPYADAIGMEGLLGVAAKIVGQLITMQDQSTMTPEMAMELVLANIVMGNHETQGLGDGPPTGRA